MSKQVEIEALRPFNKTPQGDVCEVGETFVVDATRAEELTRLNLAVKTGKSVPVTDSDEGKSATVAETQAAPKPLNKAAPKPKAKG